MSVKKPVRVLVTAGPTREYIDTVRFITNASSGRMGYACAAAAAAAGHDVTLISGPVALEPPKGCKVVHFVSVEDLKRELHQRFRRCDALLMTAAVGDFAVRPRLRRKIPRAAGPVQITLVPTEDVLGGLGRIRRQNQVLVAFSVEDCPGLGTPTGAADARRRAEKKAAGELVAKNCDYLVLNPPSAMGAAAGWACILSRAGTVLPWGLRTKDDLAREIVALLNPCRSGGP